MLQAVPQPQSLAAGIHLLVNALCVNIFAGAKSSPCAAFLLAGNTFHWPLCKQTQRNNGSSKCLRGWERWLLPKDYGIVAVSLLRPGPNADGNNTLSGSQSSTTCPTSSHKRADMMHHAAAARHMIAHLRDGIVKSLIWWQWHLLGVQVAAIKADSVISLPICVLLVTRG